MFETLNPVWLGLGGVLFVLVLVAGAVFFGMRYGKQKEKLAIAKANAEARERHEKISKHVDAMDRAELDRRLRR